MAAVEEERFRRIKHCAGFPQHAMRACLDMGGLTPADVDLFAVSRDPRAHLWRKALFRSAIGRRGTVSARARNMAGVRALPAALADALGLDARVRPAAHPLRRAPSGAPGQRLFRRRRSRRRPSAPSTASATSSARRGAAWPASRLQVDGHVFFPHSLGLLYLAITQYLGFPNYGDEFKVMGLAPYGEPRFAREIESLVHLEHDGRFELDLSYFRHASDGVQMTWDDGEPTIGTVFTPKLEALLGPARRRDEPLDAPPRSHRRLASGRLRAGGHPRAPARAARRPAARALCLAGGCAMNSVANGKIREETGFRDVFIQPAAGDNGTALGAAFHALPSDWAASARLRHGARLLGAGVRRRRDRGGARCAAARRSPRRAAAAAPGTTRPRSPTGRPSRSPTGASSAGSRAGWSGARGRSATAASSPIPRRADMRDIINTRIKFRERFRPFAPSILEEALDEYFVGAVPDPFMLQVYPVRPDKRAVVPAVTHVDGSGRLQTVSRARTRATAT